MTEHWLSYDKDRLLKDLEELDARARALFAATCAERLMLSYERFHERNALGDPRGLRSALARLWAVLEGRNGTDLKDARDCTERLLELLPSDHDEGAIKQEVSWIIEWATMEDATAAAAYAIDCALTGASQAAAWAAYKPYEALDHFVSVSLEIDFNVPGAEERVLSHPAIQAELRRQRRDLHALRGVLPRDLADLAPAMRQQAQEEGADLLMDMERGA